MPKFIWDALDIKNLIRIKKLTQSYDFDLQRQLCAFLEFFPPMWKRSSLPTYYNAGVVPT
jgi:hypothetical protein